MGKQMKIGKWAGRMVRGIRKASVRVKHAEAVHGCT